MKINSKLSKLKQKPEWKQITLHCNCKSNTHMLNVGVFKDGLHSLTLDSEKEGGVLHRLKDIWNILLGKEVCIGSVILDDSGMKCLQRFIENEVPFKE